MSPYHPTLDSFDGPAFDNHNLIRAQLGLSANWNVTSKVISDVRKYADDCKEESFTVVDNGRTTPRREKGTTLIRIEAGQSLHKRCPICRRKARVKDHVVRTLRHVDDLGSTCYLEVTLPKFKCPSCGGTPQLPFPLAREYVSFTRAFEEEVIRTLMEEDKASTALKLGTTASIVTDIVNFHVNNAYSKINLKKMRILFVDEIQFGRGHDYVTVFSNKDRRMVFMTEGKNHETIDAFAEFLVERGGKKEKIRAVSADMSPAFESGVKANFRNAKLVWDRFHLVQAVNKALDDVRKRTSNSGEKLGKIKYTVLYSAENLPEKHWDRMEKIRLHNPELALAYDMKEAFCAILKIQDGRKARAALNRWFKWVLEEGCPEFVKRASIYQQNIGYIVSWFKFRISNGVAEGINSVLKKIKSQACGYSNLVSYRNMCLLRIGAIRVTI